MPTKQTIKAAQRDKRQGKSASTQAGEFVKAEMDRIRKGQTGARSSKQAIAIGLSEARRAGVELKAPAKGKTSEKTRKNAERALAKGQRNEPIDPVRSRARTKAMKKEGTEAASPRALSRQATTAAKQRSSADRSNSAKQAARTKGPAERSAAAKKAARTRAQHSR
ncbi:MAG TPA: DUF6496 domain-containing protein [Puia sp.]|jgi:hypothetical protein|nr:DUF6496 domain-containing protein [Puia sp.]